MKNRTFKHCISSIRMLTPDGYTICEIEVYMVVQYLFEGYCFLNVLPSSLDGSLYVPSLPDDEIFNPYDKGGF